MTDDKLRKLAEAVMQGSSATRDREFHAEANPTKIIELLDTIESQRKLLDHALALASALTQHCASLTTNGLKEPK